MTGERFFNDDPVDGGADTPDLLGRKTYAQHVVTLLQRVREQSESGVLALIGPWGAGKSSVLQMAMRELQPEAPVIRSRVLGYGGGCGGASRQQALTPSSGRWPS